MKMALMGSPLPMDLEGKITGEAFTQFQSSDLAGEKKL